MRVVGPGGRAAVLVVDRLQVEAVVGGRLDQDAEVAGAGVAAVFADLLRLVPLAVDALRPGQPLTAPTSGNVLLWRMKIMPVTTWKSTTFFTFALLTRRYSFAEKRCALNNVT